MEVTENPTQNGSKDKENIYSHIMKAGLVEVS